MNKGGCVFGSEGLSVCLLQKGLAGLNETKKKSQTSRLYEQ